MDIVLRVASRFVRGGVIPDKFFKGNIALLKQLLTISIKSPDEAQFVINDRILPFYKKFEQDLIEFGMHRHAEQSVRDRFDTIRSIVEKIANAHGALHKATYAFPPRGAYAEVLAPMEMAVRSAYEEKFKTVGQAFKSTWSLDVNQLEALAKRLLSKATAQELEALEKSSGDNYSNSVINTKYDFLERVNAKAATLKLVKKEKITWDPFRSIEMLRGALESSYSEQADVVPDEFDIQGMKVIVDDTTMTQGDVKHYIGYLKEAYARLKAKNFGKVWYGTTFISCKDCGGVNDNTGGGVGGHFNIQKDWVKVFSRPSPFIVELMVHELGHRHWFKGMSSEQRARFEGLVRTHEGRNPKKSEAKLIPLSVMAKKRQLLQRVTDEFLEHLRKLESEAEKNQLSKDELRSWKGIFRGDENAMTDLYSIGSGLVERGGDLYQSKESLQLGTEYSNLLMGVQGSILDKFNEMLESYEPNESVEFWTGYFITQATKLRELGESYLLNLMRGHNETAKLQAEKDKTEIDEKWNADPRQVMPVSDYGSSNIDEAFAEVFAHYILGHDMNRDQLESFKSVFASQKTMADLGPHEHYVQVCGGCKTVLAQCRCNGPRTTVYGTCGACS